MTAWQLVGLICTTDSAAGSGEIVPKSYGKVYSYLTRVLVLQSHPADHYMLLTPAWLLCLHNALAALGG